MTTSYQIAIVAHVDRAEMAETLREQTAADRMFVDAGSHGCEGNHTRAWTWHTEHAHDGHDWAVVLEDDALPVPGFRDQLDAALAVAPAPIVSLYLGTGNPTHWQPRIQAALPTDAHWLVTHSLIHAVAVAIRTELLPITIEPNMPVDYAISNWAKHEGHQVAYTQPSLVDHADQQPVITKRYDGKPRTQPRRAHTLGTRSHWTNQLAPLS